MVYKITHDIKFLKYTMQKMLVYLQSYNTTTAPRLQSILEPQKETQIQTAKFLREGIHSSMMSFIFNCFFFNLFIIGG